MLYCVLCNAEHAGHARELVKDLVLTDFHGIVIVSGDGLIFEVCRFVSIGKYSLWRTVLFLTLIYGYFL